MIKQACILLVVSFALFACNNNSSREGNSESTQTEEIRMNANMVANQKTFEGIELPVYVETMNGKKAKKIVMPTGAEINVPADAFVDKFGNVVKGDVTIKYKEIKSPSDIIIENIDMTYDSAGQTYQFMTAGMFDLRAYSGTEELYLNKGKEIEVSYLSEKQGDYGFYKNDGGWKYVGMPKENVPLNANVEDDKATGLLMPTAANAEDDLIIDISTSHKNIPELAIYKNVLWKYAGNLSTTEVAEILGKPVSNTSLVKSNKKGEYIYKFRTQQGNYDFAVKPVFSPKVMKEAMKSYNESLARQGNKPLIKRTVDVTQLGLMNYDAIYHRSDAVVVQVEFKVKDNEQIKVQGLPLFHITGEDNVLINISDKQQITYSKTMNNKIVAVLPGQKVAVMGTTDFLRAINNGPKGQKVVLELNQLEAQIKSPSDLNNIISDL